MKWSATIFLLAFASGLYLLGSSSWNAAYKTAIIMHPALGAAAFAMVFARWRRALRPYARPALIAAIAAAGIMIASFAWSPLAWGVVAAIAWPVLSPRARVRSTAVQLCDAVAGSSVALLATSGLLFLGLGGGRFPQSMLVVHRAATITFCLALVTRSIIATRSSASALRLMAAPAGAVAVLATLVGWYEMRSLADRPHYRFNYSTYRLELRGPDEVDRFPAHFTEHQIATAASSCGTTSCHADILADHSRSVHNTSLRSSYIQKNMELLSKEIGAHNQIICGGCHFSRMLFEREITLAVAYSGNTTGLACTYCHQVSAVHLSDDLRKTAISIELNADHLRMFRDGGTEGISAFHRALIRMNPGGHGRVFSRPLYGRDEFCQVCHRLTIRPTPETPLQKPGCIDCHMQPRSEIGLAGNARNHVFPGTNLANPHDLGDDWLLDLNRRFSEGDLPVKLSGWGSFWDPRDSAEGKMRWVVQKALPITDPVPGQPFGLRIITVNASIDHLFPGGPLDLLEVWQRVIVTDPAGHVVYAVGDLLPDNRMDPAAHTLGGFMLGDDGHVVRQNRVWQIKSKIITRALPFMHHTQDDYYFTWPSDATELVVRSEWLYRKLDHAFLQWAYDATDATIPILVASRMEAVIPLR